MYLVIDSETTGLPRDLNARLDDSRSWPRVVQVAWCLYDAQERNMESVSHIIRPVGFSIPPDVEHIHGITTERARADGIDLDVALAQLRSAADQSTVLVAHNMLFDRSVISAEYFRLGQEPPFARQTLVCTKMDTTDFCQLPGRYSSYKWPTLSELHWKLFESEYEECHEAAADAAVCARCFFELKKRGVIALDE